MFQICPTKKLKVKGDWKIRKPGVAGRGGEEGTDSRNQAGFSCPEVSLSTGLFQKSAVFSALCMRKLANIQTVEPGSNERRPQQRLWGLQTP